MSAERFDVVVIGSGSGGLTVGVGLARFGKRVAVVERGPVGGDCTNTGCIPSKRLLHLARVAGPSFDGAAILADVRATRDGLSAREREELLEADPNITPVWGQARFTSPSAVAVTGPDGDRRLTAPHIVIATGSRPRDLAIPGLPHERTHTNESLFELAVLPRHLAVVGAGAIGVEMATALALLGTRVTVIDIADRVLPTADPEASAVLYDALTELGVDVRLGARVTGYDVGTASLGIATNGGEDAIGGVDAVLVAIGRVANVEALDLAAAAVVAGPGGIATDRWGRTRVKGIWAVGDVAGTHQTHAANAMGRRIVQRIALPWLPPAGRPPLIPSAVFSAPEVAWVGAALDEIARRHHPRGITRLRIDLTREDRGLTDGLARGVLVIDARRLTGRILGATVVSPNASELIAPLTIAMSRKVSLLRLSRMTYAYPTFAAAIGAAGDAFARDTLPHLRREAGAYLRYRFRSGKRNAG